MRVFKNKAFVKFARREGISDSRLCAAIKNAEAGLVDADYGGGVVKQRIARAGEGKSGGYRSVILYRRADKAFFVYGFAKNDRQNIDATEVFYFKKLARSALGMNDDDIARVLANGTYEEVFCHGQDTAVS